MCNQKILLVLLMYSSQTPPAKSNLSPHGPSLPRSCLFPTSLRSLVLFSPTSAPLSGPPHSHNFQNFLPAPLLPASLPPLKIFLPTIKLLPSHLCPQK